MRSKAIISTILLLVSTYASAKCVDGLTDKSIKFCTGSKVYVSTTGGQVVGPMILKSISDANHAVVQLEGYPAITKKVVPSIMVAIDSGCTSNGVCVGSVATHLESGIDFKIVGRFEDNYVAAAACLNDSCTHFAVGRNDIIREFDVNDLQLIN